MQAWEKQAGYDVRLEWGLAGAMALAEDVDVAVVVDVLSFTTTLSVALDLGSVVLPFPWRDGRARAFAAERDAVLALGRREAGPGQVSLSPASLRSGTPPARLVLPSPNGSTIAHALAATGVTVLAASLRNVTAVATWLQGRGTVGLVPAGERWPDGSLRPSVEDLWGAGAVAAQLAGSLSPEAEAAVASLAALDLVGCASARELVDGGWAADVAVAGEVDASTVVPVLVDGTFVDADMSRY